MRDHYVAVAGASMLLIAGAAIVEDKNIFIGDEVSVKLDEAIGCPKPTTWRRSSSSSARRIHGPQLPTRIVPAVGSSARARAESFATSQCYPNSNACASAVIQPATGSLDAS
jgi:hypothetical protein